MRGKAEGDIYSNAGVDLAGVYNLATVLANAFTFPKVEVQSQSFERQTRGLCFQVDHISVPLTH